MPIRNPFARRPGAPAGNDENLRPDSAAEVDKQPPGFERVDTVGSKASALSVNSQKSQDNGEYKMSVVNDSGVYLPPSPTAEKEPAWPRKYLARNSTDTRSSIGDIEHFSISRESFDSYRRSFDISAKSPIVVHETIPRQSLDSARFPRLPRSSINERRFDRQPPTAEENFEDVGLNDDQKHQQPKKRGFFAKFGGEHNETTATSTPPPTITTSRFFTRKRGQSGQGAELGQIERPRTATSAEAQEV